jgi:ubiquinone/menaquinone biosynthesis C-methylase UbiE
MSDDAVDPKPGSGDRHAGWTAIIGAVNSRFAYVALVTLVLETMLIAVLFSSTVNTFLKCGITGASFGLLGLMVYKVMGTEPFPDSGRSRKKRRAPLDHPSKSEVAGMIATQEKEVLFASDKKRPKLDLWYDRMRPVLHQAAHYSVPMYYLDDRLNIIDWNIAFEIVFGDLLQSIRGKHVVEFIARLTNHDEVFAHARQFTQEVTDKQAFPYVDLEPIDYDSAEFGLVRSLKVATQLNDIDGRSCGWAVALWPKQIDWEAFRPKLHEQINADKMWSIYSASYDRVLLKFPPYKTLIEDVIAVVPKGNLSVVDLGAGTGNVTRALLDRGHRVTAIESNLGMLDQLAEKNFDEKRVKVIKCAMQHLDCINDDTFDAAVMVNVLYAVSEPLKCLHDIHRILRKDGVLGLSTTHRETNLDTLLGRIETELKSINQMDALADDWNAVYNVNRTLESNVLRRYTRDDIKDMVRTAGFDILKENASTYCDAVMLLHAKKRG